MPPATSHPPLHQRQPGPPPSGIVARLLQKRTGCGIWDRGRGTGSLSQRGVGGHLHLLQTNDLHPTCPCKGRPLRLVRPPSTCRPGGKLVNQSPSLGFYTGIWETGAPPFPSSLTKMTQQARACLYMGLSDVYYFHLRTWKSQPESRGAGALQGAGAKLNRFLTLRELQASNIWGDVDDGCHM